jgi:hypothetical protein
MFSLLQIPKRKMTFKIQSWFLYTKAKLSEAIPLLEIDITKGCCWAAGLHVNGK